MIKVFNLICLGANTLNGFYLKLIEVEFENLEGCLFGLDISKDFFVVHILFKPIAIYDKNLIND